MQCNTIVCPHPTFAFDRLLFGPIFEKKNVIYALSLRKNPKRNFVTEKRVILVATARKMKIAGLQNKNYIFPKPHVKSSSTELSHSTHL